MQRRAVQAPRAVHTLHASVMICAHAMHAHTHAQQHLAAYLHLYAWCIALLRPSRAPLCFLLDKYAHPILPILHTPFCTHQHLLTHSARSTLLTLTLPALFGTPHSPLAGSPSTRPRAAPSLWCRPPSAARTAASSSRRASLVRTERTTFRRRRKSSSAWNFLGLKTPVHPSRKHLLSNNKCQPLAGKKRQKTKRTFHKKASAAHATQMLVRN